MELLSIIIPVYNAEKYLRRCLESVRTQRYDPCEVLLVDDGSTDASAEICKEYVQKDARFRYFRKPNGGVADARNYALDRMDRGGVRSFY